MKLKVAQVLGLNTDQKAAQAISSIRDSDNAFFAILELSCDDAFTKGRQALSELADFYFESDGTPSEKLNATQDEAIKKFAETEHDLITAAISGKVLYFIAIGEVEVFLKRENKLSSLFSTGSSSQLISGFLEEGDRVFFATINLTNFLREDLSQQLNISLAVFEEEVADKIAAAGLEGNGSAGLLIEVEKEIEVESSVIENLDQEQISPQGPILQPSKIKERTLFIFSKFLSFIPKSGRGKLILAVAILVLLSAGIGLKVKSSRDKVGQIQFNQSLQSAKDDFNAAKGLASLNPTEAKSKLNLAKDQVNKALSLKPKDSEAQNLKKEIDQNSGSILQQSTVSDFPVFLDLDLIKKNFRSSQMSLSAGKILLLDPAVKTLVVLDIARKSNQILAGEEKLGDAKFASLNGGLAFVYSKDKGILKVDTTNQKLTTISKKDSDWGQMSDIYGFAGNIYALDNGQIWKYLPTSDGYSDKREYLTKATKVDFAGSLRMQIESSVYVLKNGGEILRFTKGEKDNFGLAGLDKGIKNPKSIFTSSDTDNLYVLDSGNSRLLVLTKTGSYKGQYSGEKFATATDLVVDEIGKKVYLLDGSKIYTVDLK